MARFRTNRNAVQSRSKRLTDWAISFTTASLVTVPVASKVLLASVTAAQLAILGPATVVRTRGRILILSDQTAGSERQFGAIGLGFVNETARALGVTALPGPSSLALWDGWFMHQFIAQAFTFGTAVGFMTQGQGFGYEIDSKAMCKFDTDDGLVLMAENSSASDGFSAAVSLRILIKAG